MAEKDAVVNVDPTLFKKAMIDMVAKNDKNWNEYFSSYQRKLKEYTKEDVAKIINSGSLEA